MDETNLADSLLKAFKNPTKLSIIALLFKNKEMTVTQISKILKTTRSNLYQSIKDLLKEKIILISRVQITKNYVEKYYKINEELFNKVKRINLMEKIKETNENDFRELMISFLVMNSFISNVFIQELKIASSEELNSYKEKFLNGLITVYFSTLNEEEAKDFNKIFYTFMDKIEKEENLKDETNLLLTIVLPWKLA
ncbi:winged helix-turn-helix domain-containing protein [Caldisphaera sp.]|uniref:winged helix-turn-helix domain-containing protein n=1 Tax=Caldisphaera sp. TaxID=2060322 RepID=UPI0025BDF995|nr:winged helix-turn-helix domain-containing protein [Caldisphaera sp.]